MKRYRLFEIEDYTWCPHSVRDGITDYLRIAIKLFGVYKSAPLLIKGLMDRSDYKTIINLCSGGGGGIETIITGFERIGIKDLKIIQTDKFPNLSSFEYIEKKFKNNISFIPSPIEADNVPKELKGIRTIFSSFHHFEDSLAKSVLMDAIKNNSSIVIFEGANRSVINIIGVFFTTIILMLLLTPFIRPFKLSRIIFTYFIPLIPIIGIWDGMVSICRISKPDELLELTKCLENNSYKWESGNIRNGILTSVYLIGYPA